MRQRELIHLLRSSGYVVMKTGGSHLHFYNSKGARITVPNGEGAINWKLIFKIRRQIRWGNKTGDTRPPATIKH